MMPYTSDRHSIYYADEDSPVLPGSYDFRQLAVTAAIALSREGGRAEGAARSYTDELAAVENYRIDELEAKFEDIGKTAYELWLEDGNAGTLTEFLASLVSTVPGPPGEDAGPIPVGAGSLDPHPDYAGLYVPAEDKSDSGWRVIDTSGSLGIRDAASPGIVKIRRTHALVTMRIVQMKLSAGIGAGFILPNGIPDGFAAWGPPEVGPARRTHLGDALTNRGTHRVHVKNNDLYWSGWDSGSGAYTETRPTDTGQAIQGEISWVTDDAIPATWPGTAA